MEHTRETVIILISAVSTPKWWHGELEKHKFTVRYYLIKLHGRRS